MRLPINNTIQVIAAYWSNKLKFDRSASINFTFLIRVEAWKSGLTKFCLRKLETSDYRVVQNTFRYVKLLGVECQKLKIVS